MITSSKVFIIKLTHKTKYQESFTAYENNIVVPLQGYFCKQFSLEFPQYLLEKADSTDNAISMLMELPIASNCNILIADKSGKMVVIECTPFTKRIRETENVDGGKIVCTVNNCTGQAFL